MLASVGADNVVRLWQTAYGIERGVQRYSWAIDRSAIAFSPNDRLLAASGSNGTTRIFNTISGEQVLTLPGSGQTSNGSMSSVLGLDFNADGSILTACTDDGMLYQWQVADGELIQSKQSRATESGHMWNGEHTLIAVSSDGQNVAYEVNSEIYVTGLDAESKGQVLERVVSPRTKTWSLAFSPDGQWLARGGGLPQGTSTEHSGQMNILLWSLSNGDQEAILEGHTSNVNSISWGPKNSSLISGSSNGTVIWWILPQAKDYGEPH
jgi:WD40 repeat protein